jgi:drug/metabolite transporter (DMT)-like permease
MTSISGRLAFPALIAANAALASGPLFVRLADVGPVASAFWRLALGLPVIAALAWWFGRSAESADGHPPVSASTMVLLAALGGLFFAADLASWHVGIMLTKMANASLFGNAASLVLAAFTLIVARRWPHRAEAGALVLAVAGAIILLRQSESDGQARLIGDLLCVLAGFLYAGYVLAMQRVRGAMGSWHALAVATAAGIPFLLITAFALGETIIPGDWRPVLMLAVMSQIIGQGLLIYALPHFSALVIGLTLLTQPALAALIGWVVYGERLNAAEITGAVLLAVALVLVRLPQRQG